MRVFVNERPLDLPDGADAIQAVRAFSPALGDAVAQGTARVVDARGIEVAPETSLAPGAILRVRGGGGAGPADDAHS